MALSADGVLRWPLGAYGEGQQRQQPDARQQRGGRGHRYITRTATGWAQQAYLKAPVPGERFL